MGTKEYCKKYNVTRSKLLYALYNGHLHATRYRSGWDIDDEPINPAASLGFYVDYVSCFLTYDYSTFEECSTYDEALYTCKLYNWWFETSAHGHDTWESDMVIHIQ